MSTKVASTKPEQTGPDHGPDHGLDHGSDHGPGHRKKKTSFQRKKSNRLRDNDK